MMTFCKKSVHSFLGLSTIPMNLDDDNKQPCSSKCLALLTSGLGLTTATAADSHKTPNVLESASVVKSSSSSSSSPPPSPFKKDPGGFGFIDDVGGGVNGLMSCTESLGFESSDERRVDDEIELCSRMKSTANKVKWRKIGERREVKKFPPPISSLDHNGHPCFFLRPIRKDGRLELTEVRIDRPEILRAYREHGRLRLHLVRDEDSDINEELQVQDQEHEKQAEILEEEKIEEEEVGEEEEEEEETSEEWRFPVNGEGFRRCHELGTQHHDYHHGHHHNLHVWSQHCVTTR
ncbi:hypothetical protein P3X46_008468 [Hevea brasiliensis]|uniref:FAF domain-containing protein n=1 Tax=Hevea brasiliensis TaxID=3981 RepID=A0ABQ9ML48_HEVBR|nr:protein FANTASTIC FOUR 3 [Hevea brasiliensis]KAJ9180192.1 hypothetical protein P3X46_008468 [Hevea brasiliensis]